MTAPPKSVVAASAARTCTSCGGHEIRGHFTARGFDSADERFDLYRCDTCRVVEVYPQPTTTELARYYRDDYYGGSASKKMSGKKFGATIEALLARGANARASRMASLVTPPARVLDVGCGRAKFLQAMSARGFACTGTDISDFDRSGTADAKITYRRAYLEDCHFDAGSFDAVSIWQVLEHTLNPDATVSEISRILTKGGIISVAVPNLGSWQARLFGPFWFHLDLPRHLFHFERPVLEALLRAHGFEVLSVGTFDPLQHVFGTLQSALNALFPSRPNHFFSLLKNKAAQHGLSRLGWLAAYSVLSGILILPALLELAVSTALGRGAVLEIYARKVA